MSIRDKILSLKKDFKKIEFKFDEETIIYICEPSIKQVNQATELRFEKDAQGNTKIKEDSHIDVTMYYLVNLVIDKDGKQIFEMTDKDTIFNHGSNSKFAELISLLWSFIRGESEKK